MVLNEGSFLLSNVSPFEPWTLRSCIPFLDIMPGRKEGAGRRQGGISPEPQVCRGRWSLLGASVCRLQLGCTASPTHSWHFKLC